MKLGRSALLSITLLGANRVRTLLSVLGVVVGVAAVILMVAVGRGAEARVVGRIRAMGTDMVMVSAAPPRQQAGRARQGEIVASLLPADVPVLRDECPSVKAAAGAIDRSMSIRYEASNIMSNTVGLAPPGLAIRGFALQAGRFYDEDDERTRRRVAVIGPVVAQNLFGSDDPIGATLRIGSVPFEVIGVTTTRGADANGTDQDNIVLVPLETAMRRLFNVSHVGIIYLQASSSDHLNQVEQGAREILRRQRRLGDTVVDPFKILNQATLLAGERVTARAMTLLIGSVSAIALLIGGAGILAVMTLSVRQRIHEVGLRRALGARRRDILVQFLLESTMLAGLGGLLGALLGLGGAGIAAATGAWDVVVSWPTVLASLAISIAIGVIFGVYPARRAANLTPVGALRGE